MIISDESFFALSANRRSLLKIAELFQLTPEEIDHPNCGEWITDCIKQLQTALLAVKSAKMRQNENQTIENYIPDPFLNKVNPLVEPGNPEQA